MGKAKAATKKSTRHSVFISCLVIACLTYYTYGTVTYRHLPTDMLPMLLISPDVPLKDLVILQCARATVHPGLFSGSLIFN